MAGWRSSPLRRQQWHLWRSVIGMGQTLVGRGLTWEYALIFCTRKKLMQPKWSSWGSVVPTAENICATSWRYPSMVTFRMAALPAARIPTQTHSAKIFRYGIRSMMPERLGVRESHVKNSGYFSQEVLLAH